VRQLVTGALLATVALVVLLGARPTSRETILAGYAIALAAIGLAALTNLLQAARETTPSRFEAELMRQPAAPSRPADLIRAERELVLAASDDGHFRRRLRPLLIEIAAMRGVDDDFDVTSPTMRDLTAMIDRLEAH
jgi:predicted aspartyl protease